MAGRKIPSEAGKKYAVGRGKPPQATQFQKGQSGNPGGLPKGTPKVSIGLMKLLATAPGEKFKPASRAEQLAWAIFSRALSGDVRAVREIADRTEGKPRQSLDIDMQVLDWRELARRNGFDESEVMREAKRLIESAADAGGAESD
ncbi:MAG TPA: DUF5681 domain-containing protein [Methylocella sp.]|nr:DUF5681 domain-containing protein [Methylocella sp.]